MPLISRDNDLDVEKAITAMIVAPTIEDAVEVMRADGYQCNEVTLLSVLARPSIRERYEKRRDELAPLVEGRFANDLLDNASRATAVIGLAIEQVQAMLEAGRVLDPARVARDLSQVAAQSVDKRLALQGRPTVITEHRDVREIVRALQAMKVVQVIESTAEEVDV